MSMAGGSCLGGALSMVLCAQVLSFRLSDALGGDLDVSECATSVKSDVADILVYRAV